MVDEKEKVAWLQLARSENVGPATFQSLLKYYKSAAAALDAIPELAKCGGRKAIKVFSKTAAEKEYEATLKIGGEIVTSCEEAYPDLLRQIHDFPPVITVMGKKEVWHKPCVAIVGTRNATVNGKQISKKIAYDLAEAGYVVVSGMALGIDRKAHEGALMKGVGTTIAVVGSGIDVVYPLQNEDIYGEIKEKGTIISEFPLGSSPQAMNFPRRNRIISGLSLGTVVIEAQKRSGSLITAGMALEQNREVFAVPGSPLDARGQGPNHLIKQGAHLVESAGDVINVLRENRGFVLREESLLPEDPPFSTHSEQEMPEARKIVLENLSANSISIDNIIRETGLPYPVISLVLLELELAGRLERRPGGQVALVMGQ